MCSLASHKDSAQALSPILLERLRAFVETSMGLHFPPARPADLERAISSASSEFGFDNVEACMEWLLSAPLSRSQFEILASHLTIGETYFFRDSKVFEILQSQVLPEIINARRGREQHLRIWNAGCATGEEPYSLGILLTRLIPDLRDWALTILATDISPVSLKKAAEGVYGEWSFRDTPRWVKEGCFQKTGQHYHIDSRIKGMVTFSFLNLAADPYPALINNTNAIDIIFCRNVLMYFSQDRAITVMDNLSRCLVDGGWLVISPVETPGAGLPRLLHPVHFPGALLYRKGARPRDAGTHPIPRPAAPKATKKTAVAGSGHSHRPGRQCTPSPLPLLVSAETGRRPEQVRRLAGQGRLAEALALCAEEIQSDKLNPSLHYLQATILQEMGRPEDAAAALQRAIYIDQDFVIAHFALGHLLHRQGRFREAGKHLAKASSLLGSCDQEDILPEAEGLHAGRLIELIKAMQNSSDRR